MTKTVEQGWVQRMDESPMMPLSEFDIEPTYDWYEPLFAFIHAQTILKATYPDYPIEQIRQMIHPAVGLLIPSSQDPQKILYVLRDAGSKEFPNAWGLPSTGIDIEQGFRLKGPNEQPDTDTFHGIVEQMLTRKGRFTSAKLIPKDFLGWTGRLRGPQNGFAEEYYLVMIDIVTQPVDPDTICTTDRYPDFQLLTPEEHHSLITHWPNTACGACSTLVYEIGQQTR